VPVVVVSSLTPSGSAKALEALAAGALDVLAKPDGSGNLGQLANRLAYHVKAAARSRRAPPRLKLPTEPAVPIAPPGPPRHVLRPSGNPDWILHRGRRGSALPAAAITQRATADRGGAAHSTEFFPHPGQSLG
jgi:chemotaxis response regulator CheB